MIATIAVAFECPFDGPTAASRRCRNYRRSQSLLKAGADQLVLADTIGAADPTAGARID